MLATFLLLAATPAPQQAIAARMIRAGEIAVPADVSGDASVVGLKAKRMIAEGAVIDARDFAPPALVARNSVVTLEYEKGELLITTEGRALAPGADGEAVRVMTLASRIVVVGTVVGENRVRVRR